MRTTRPILLSMALAGGFALAGDNPCEQPFFAKSNDVDFTGLVWDIEAADVDLDGDVDLIVSELLEDTIGVLLNDGTGGFSTSLLPFFSQNQPLSLALGDFNGDGLPEIVTANQDSDTISFLFNGDDGSFGALTVIHSADSPQHVSVADVNDDGHLDVIAVSLGDFSNPCSCWPDGEVAVLLGDGAANFTLDATYDTGLAPRRAVLGDVNGDGHLDMVVTNSGTEDSANAFHVRLGAGDGTFGAESVHHLGCRAKMCLGPWAAALGDVDGDGDADLALALRSDNAIEIHLNDGTGQFSFDTFYEAFFRPEDLEFVDVDGDGDRDLLSVNRDGNDLMIRLNTNGVFDDVWSYNTGVTVQALATGDFDEDGLVDVAITRSAQFGGQQGISVFFNECGSCPADLNLDGLVDTIDLLIVLGEWGVNPGAEADLSGDDVVDTIDLLELLGAWGPCP